MLVHILDSTGRHQFFRARLGDTRDLLRIEMRSRRKQVTPTGSQTGVYFNDVKAKTINISDVNVGLSAPELQELTKAAVAGAVGPLENKMIDLSQRLGVTQGAALTMLRTLGYEGVPIERLPDMLATAATQILTMRQALSHQNHDERDVVSLKRQALSALDAGKFDKATRLLKFIYMQEQETSKKRRQTVKWTLTMFLVSTALVLYIIIYNTNIGENVVNHINKCSAAKIANLKRSIDQNITNEEMEAAKLQLPGVQICDLFWYYATLARVNFYEKDFKSAIENFTKAKNLNSNDEIVQRDLADSLVEDGDPEKALDIYKAVDNNSQEMRYKIGRAYLYADKFVECINRVHNVPTSLIEEGHRGKARIIEAAAYMGLSKEASDNSDLLVEAKLKLQEGINEEPSYWMDILAANSLDKHEGYLKAKELLSPIVSLMLLEKKGR